MTRPIFDPLQTKLTLILSLLPDDIRPGDTVSTDVFKGVLKSLLTACRPLTPETIKPHRDLLVGIIAEQQIFLRSRRGLYEAIQEIIKAEIPWIYNPDKSE